MKELRKIIHVDMDAFFASVEQRDNPRYRGKPLVVGGKGRRGVVSAASYEARKYGIHSAMPSHIASNKCPHLIFAPPRFEVYKEVSNQIRDIFNDYTDLVEPLSLDEAFLDVTENKVGIPSASIIAKDIKRRIKLRTDLTASAGVANNKFLAKIASDYNKPDGFFLIEPKDAEAFVEQLPVEKFFGVGKVTANKMHNFGIFKGIDLKKIEYNQLVNLFGNQASYFYNIARAIDNRPVVAHRLRKSIGTERTYEKDLKENDEIDNALIYLISDLFRRCSKNNTFGKTLTLKLKYNDFTVSSLSKTFPDFIYEINDLHLFVFQLREKADFSKSVRLLGLSVSKLDNLDYREEWKQMIIPFFNKF